MCAIPIDPNEPGESLKAALSRAFVAALADSAIHAAYTAVTDELDPLAGK